MGTTGDGLWLRVALRGYGRVSFRFAVPYYVVQGRDALLSPTPLVKAYFAKVEAPAKHLVTIDGAGLFALATHQAEVIATPRQSRSERS